MTVTKTLATVVFGVWVSLAQTGGVGTPTPPKVDGSALLTRATQLYGAKSYATALMAFRQAAETGSVEAMMYLGVMYGTGQGTVVDYKRAAEWFRKAAQAGESQAMNNLGLLYYQGNGVTKDYHEALSWFHKAADQGNSEAMFNTGLLCRDGLGVAASREEAIGWYRRAAARGNAAAKERLKVLGVE